jgi:hypothetical protein
VAYNPCGVSSTSQLLYKEFLNSLFTHGEHCLGRAVFAAKCSIIARYPEDDSIYGPAVLWTLLGDPALRVRHRITSGIEEDLTPQAPSYVLTISPNPCDAAVRIRIPPQLQTANCTLVTVYDASGRIVYSQPVRDSSFVIRTSSFSDGVYVARCVSGENYASVRLLVRHR